MNNEFWNEMGRQLTIDLKRAVLSDVVVEINKKQEEGLIINQEEMMDIINNLSQKYGN